MADDARTRVIYEILADFSSLSRNARQARRELDQLKATEEAYNASSQKARQNSTRSANARQKAVTGEVVAMRTLIGQLDRYARRQDKSTIAVRSGTKAINAQNRTLATNAERLTEAAGAAEAYSKAQRRIGNNSTNATGSARALREEISALDKATLAHDRNANARTRDGRSAVKFVEEVGHVNTATGEVVEGLRKSGNEMSVWGRLVERARTSLNGFRRDGNDLPPVLRRVRNEGNGLYKFLRYIQDWRPRLIPPFVVLIPVIAAVIGALNPLVALLGSVGAAGFGLASNIASLSGVFLALPGILSAVVSGLIATITAFKGVGDVFKAYSALQKSAGGGGSSQADRADTLARAERNLARSQRAVLKAQQDLNKAREEATKDLRDLRIEVERASLNEDAAIAALQQARDAYNNVQADPASQRGDKLEAAVRVREAENDLADVRQKNIDNQRELNRLEAQGVEGSDKVVDAQERLADALEAQQDAIRDANGGSAGGSAAATAMDEYTEALNKLSPSARTVVLALIALQDEWEDMRRTVQESLFSRVVGSLDKLPRIIQSIGAFLRPAAAAMGDFFAKLIDTFASDEWTTDIAAMGENNGGVLRSMGNGAIFLLTAIKDLMIAAAPFTQWLVDSLAKGAENFSNLVRAGRDSGDLATWLQKVEGRLSRWWRIVKNIGVTLFNYGAAASEFGDWLSEGLESLSAGWAENSRNAREDNSDFRKYLEDIKPLLDEVNGLLGDFFGWLRREIMNPDNIEDAQDLVKLVRDDLGPALGNLLDALAKSDIDEKLITALTSIVDAVTGIVEAGGGAGFESFMDTIAGFFGIISDVLSNLPPGAADALTRMLGALVALGVIANWTGVTAVLGMFATVGTGAAATGGMFSSLAGLNALRFAGPIAFLTALSAVSAEAVQSWIASLTADEYDSLKTKPTGISKEQYVSDRQASLGIRIASGDSQSGFAPSVSSGQGSWLQQGLNGDSRNKPTQATWASVLRQMGYISDRTRPNGGGSFAASPSTRAATPGTRDREGGGSFGSGVSEGLQDMVTRWFRSVFGTTGGVDRTRAGGGGRFSAGLAQGIQEETSQAQTIWQAFWTTFTAPIAKPLAAFQTSFATAFTWIGTYVFQPFNVALMTLGTWVSGAVSNIGSIWSGLQTMFRDPINWVISNVYNNGIASFWNGIASKFGWAQLTPINLIGDAGPARGMGSVTKRAQGGVLPGYTPGRDVHTFTSPTAGTLKLSGGEGILVPEATRAIGGEQAIKRINSDARRNKFAAGGVFKTGGSATKSNNASSNNKSGIIGSIGDMYEALQGFFSDPFGYVVNGMNGLVGGAMGALQGNDYGKLISSIPSAIINGLGNWAKTTDTPALGGAENAMGWARQWAVLKAAFPTGVNLNDAYRPGDPNYHGKGRAIDVTPSAAVFEWIRKNYPNSRELIYSPANGRQLLNGGNYLWPEPIRSQHFNHVHWAMRQGGVLPKLKGTHDQGGWLGHGQTAVNMSGKPEAVLTNEESRALRSILDGNGLRIRDDSLNISGAFGGAPGAGAAMVDASVTIENLTIQNPVQEPLSVSIPKAIRQVGYLNNARAGG